ncbi:MAG: DUF2142 domain-containing protein [Erysipelotrichaceae bacterium]|nr:DUF2142 domain-containing protein [Erysipelotrichaceae bacterium]
MEKKSLWERVKENFKKNKFILLGFLVIWAITVFYTVNYYKDTHGKESVGNELNQNVVEVTENTEIRSIIPTDQLDSSESICVKFATFADPNIEGQVNVRVIGMDTKTVYANKWVDVNEVQDNAFYNIKFTENLYREKETNIMVIITSNSVEGKGMGVYYSNEKCFGNSSLTVDKEFIENGDLTIRFLIDSPELTGFNNFIIIWMAVIVTLLILLMLLIEPKMEVLFAFMALTFGLTYMIVITPMSVPDETAHYEFAFQVSNYMMGDGENHLYFDEEYQNYGSFAGHLNVSAAYMRLINRINRPLTLKDNMVPMGNDIDEYYKVCFIPQAIGITLARIFNWNMLRTFYMGRFFNLLFYVLCIYLAIKRTPVHKLLFGILVTCPMFMQQAASYSYDCYINALSFLVIANFLKWMYQEEKIDWKDYIFVFIVNLLISPVKVVYSLFTLMYIFVPVSRYKDKKSKIIGTIILLLPMVYFMTSMLWELVFRAIRKFIEKTFMFTTNNTLMLGNNTGVFGLAVSGSGVVHPYAEEGIYNFSYVINHPYETLVIFMRTIRYCIKFWFYSSFGRTLSGDSLILPLSLVHVITGLLFVTAFRKENYVEPIFTKVLYIFLCVIAALMILGGMFISWTEVDQTIIEDYGGPIIQGIQGRYFSPLLAYFFSIFNNGKIGFSKKFDKYILMSFFIIFFEVIMYVLSYTYIN